MPQSPQAVAPSIVPRAVSMKFWHLFRVLGVLGRGDRRSRPGWRPAPPPSPARQQRHAPLAQPGLLVGRVRLDPEAAVPDRVRADRHLTGGDRGEVVLLERVFVDGDVGLVEALHLLHRRDARSSSRVISVPSALVIAPPSCIRMKVKSRGGVRHRAVGKVDARRRRWPP